MDFFAVAQECAPAVHPQTLAAIVQTESGFNPFAIGVVNGRLERQPRSLPEAVATARALVQANWNASFGLGQINLSNLSGQSLDLVSVFDPCLNLKAASSILGEAYGRAKSRLPDEQSALQAAISAYYSGNFSTGFKEGYVQKVAANAALLQREDALAEEKSTGAAAEAKPIRVVPALQIKSEPAVRGSADGTDAAKKPVAAIQGGPATPKPAGNSSVIFVSP
jgi:type IV secretion system protein VirB1